MVLGPIVVCLLVAWIAWITFSTIRRYLVAKLQASLQAKLLDRIDSSQALLAYVATDPGRKLVDALRLEQEDRAAPFRSILLGVQACIVLIVLGGTFLLLHASKILPDDSAVVMGALPMALGIGFGIAAGATYVISRNFGLLSDNRRS
jgi:NAD kinase